MKEKYCSLAEKVWLIKQTNGAKQRTETLLSVSPPKDQRVHLKQQKRVMG